MADETTSAAPVAESQPAEPQAAAETQTAPKPIESWTDAERSEWLKTGDTPKPKAGGESASPASSEAEQAESAPGSEPGKDTQQEQAAKGKQNAETRKRQLGGEIQTLLEQRRQLREENERLAAQRRGETRPEPPAGPQAAPGGRHVLKGRRLNPSTPTRRTTQPWTNTRRISRTGKPDSASKGSARNSPAVSRPNRSRGQTMKSCPPGRSALRRRRPGTPISMKRSRWGMCR